MDRETIFSEALQKATTAERKRFLDQVCGDDTTLRIEIESLLAAHDAAGSFLQNLPTGPMETMSADGEDPDDAWRNLLGPSDVPGCLGTLGPYHIVEFIGRGGMGVVLRAHDPKLNRAVAIKLLAPALATNAMAVKRFLREARAAAAVSHAHVVTIYAIDEGNLPPFIVMEFINGPSLQQKIEDRGALELKEILRIGAQTAAGLAAAHRQGVVHRDVKPANILLENGIEKVKISDFGLARAMEDVSITQTGQISGTPQFMSPEQAQGESVDARSDLFSLGSVMYTMCTGRPPFRADSAIAVLRRVCDDRPKPIRELNPDIPPWLEEITARLLAKDPAERFQSAGEVAELLGQCLAQLQASTPQAAVSLQAAPQQASRKKLRWKRSTCALLSLLAVVSFFVAGSWFYARPRPPCPGAVQCPDNGHWYVVVHASEGINWEQASQRALEMGGHLATITNERENDFVIRLLDDPKYWYVNLPVGAHNLGPLLGAIQLDGSREPDGGWRWITGEPFLFSAWHIDGIPEHSQPNDGQSPHGPQTRMMYCMRENDCLRARWGDVCDGDGARSFVVEFDDLPVVDSHPRVDPYGTIVFRENKNSRRVGVHVTPEGGVPIITDFTDRYTVFVAPGSYHWKLLDISGETPQRLLSDGTIEITAGQRVEFTTDGPILDDRKESTTAVGVAN